jgi:hypothetical protein
MIVTEDRPNPRIKSHKVLLYAFSMDHSFREVTELGDISVLQIDCPKIRENSSLIVLLHDQPDIGLIDVRSHRSGLGIIDRNDTLPTIRARRYFLAIARVLFRNSRH